MAYSVSPFSFESSGLGERLTLDSWAEQSPGSLASPEPRPRGAPTRGSLPVGDHRRGSGTVPFAVSSISFRLIILYVSSSKEIYKCL